MLLLRPLAVLLLLANDDDNAAKIRADDDDDDDDPKPNSSSGKLLCLLTGFPIDELMPRILRYDGKAVIFGIFDSCKRKPKGKKIVNKT